MTHRGQMSAPVVLCPFTPRISPHADGVQRWSLHWATRHGLLDRPGARATFARAKFANLMCRAHPDAGESELRLATAWLISIFVLDDLLERALVRDPEPARAAVAEVVRLVRDQQPAPILGTALGRPLAAALGEVWRRTEPRVSPAWRERFVGHVADYLAGTLWEAGNRTSDSPPLLEEYRRMRHLSAATDMFFDLIEPMHGVELPQALLDDPDFAIARRTAGTVIGIFNDLISWPKEAAIGDHHNIVFSFQREQRLPLAEAVTAAVAEHDARVIEFQVARARLEARFFDDPPAMVGIADLVHWIRGNLDWSMESGRYTPADLPPPRRPVD
ncbi:terpene synthase family protein [Dactylosporangium sp. CA-233914]|uniref:terpene synthase family protein n=1 Tax=Dactylosporangium sp. CA-233914 TaxID=3239934 RepID=UPI003D940737